MFQHLLFLLSESVTLPAALCLCLGMLVYFTLHNWQKVGALSRNRSQLLSVGVVLAVVLLILQLSARKGWRQQRNRRSRYSRCVPYLTEKAAK